jgi:excisionase family DNA binding protein
LTFTELTQAMSLPDKPLYSPNEAADLLGVTRTTISAWLREGRLDGLKAGKHWKQVTRTSLKAFVEGAPSV